ncbi:hypothetical protein, partial [Acinetobacter baumannii]|uniref:hypothetical protein n=1 Tax=Acinetobacter baumannii TaxID=470 RepID=UPI0033971AD8
LRAEMHLLTSVTDGASMSTSHVMVGREQTRALDAAGQLNWSWKCSAHRERRRCLLQISEPSFSQMVSLTPDFFAPEERISWKSFRMFPAP